MPEIIRHARPIIRPGYKGFADCTGCTAICDREYTETAQHEPHRDAVWTPLCMRCEGARAKGTLLCPPAPSCKAKEEEALAYFKAQLREMAGTFDWEIALRCVAEVLDEEAQDASCELEWAGEHFFREMSLKVREAIKDWEAGAEQKRLADIADQESADETP